MSRFLKASLLLYFTLSFLHAENSISLYIITPSGPLDWSSPGAITGTTLHSDLNSDFHAIGHVMEHLQCDATASAPAVDELSGATTLEDAPEPDLLFNQGIGMGLFYYNFAGKLNDADYVWQQLNAASQMLDRLSTMRFLISPSTCARLAQYLREYHEQGVDQHYGMYLRPRYHEGAGCTAFGASFLEVAGLLTADIKKAWSINLQVQEKLIGYPINNYKVTVNDLLFGSEARHWATSDEVSRGPLLVYDTQFFVAWLQKIWEKGEKHFPAGYSIDQYNYKKWHQSIWITIPAPGTDSGTEDDYVSNGVMSLLVDARNVPTPTEGIWLK